MTSQNTNVKQNLVLRFAVGCLRPKSLHYSKFQLLMSRRAMFHESYYEHSCILQSDKDVLYMDIKGKNCWASVQRWWHNLFLLAYDDVRCRIYYTSSQAMRLERMRQFRQYRNRIHPLSKFSNMWTWFIFIVSASDRVTFHHNSSILYGGSPIYFYYIGALLDVLLILDLCICFKTGYIDYEARRVILSKTKGYIQFATTKLFLYTAGAIPLHIFLLLRYGVNAACNRCKSNRFVCVLKLLSIFALYRVFEGSKQLLKERKSFKLMYFLKFLRIALLALITMFQFLNFSDTVYTINMIETQTINNSSHLAYMIQFLYYYQPPKGVFLCFEFSFICKSLLMFGYGFMEKTFYLDIMIGLIGYIVAMVFNMWSLMECYAVLDRLKSAEDQNTMMKDRTMNMLLCRQLSDVVSAKVKKYYEFDTSQMLMVEKMNDLHHFLPSTLHREIRLNSYMHLVKRIPYFANWPLEVVEGLVLRLQDEIYLEEDVVADKWTTGDGLAILEVGVLAVYDSREEEVGHLIDGDFFGELSLVTDKEVRTSSVVAVTNCKLLLLYKMPFRKYMRQYPQLFYEIRDRLRQKYSTVQSSYDLLSQQMTNETTDN